MKTIHKFHIEDGSIVVAAGLGPTVLVGSQGNAEWIVWCEVDLERPLEAREFRVFGTGFPMPGLGPETAFRHSGSWQNKGFVWHVYERAAPVPGDATVD